MRIKCVLKIFFKNLFFLGQYNCLIKKYNFECVDFPHSCYNNINFIIVVNANYISIWIRLRIMRVTRKAYEHE